MSSMGGAPCWVSLATRDMQATQAFYTRVLGWDYRPSSLGPEFSVGMLEGEPVAGLNELPTAWHVPSGWMVYFRVQDADLAASRIQERAGTMAVGPLEVGSGRAAIAADPAGACFGLWQGETLEGWSVGEAEDPAWIELLTPDPFAAALFYGEVLDWSAQESSLCHVAHVERDEEVFIRARGRTVAGLKAGGAEAAAEVRVRPRWHVHFRVPNVDSAIAAATEAGGEVLAPAQPMALGRAAILRDPEGAVFSLLST